MISAIPAGLTAGKMLIMVLGLVAFGAGAYWMGYDQSESKHRKAIIEQALEANENMRKANDNNARILNDLAVTMAQLVKKEDAAIGIQERYEKSTEEKFIIGHQLELAVDALSRLHNATEDRVPSPAIDPGTTVEPEKAVATSAALLGAYGDCTKQLTRVLDAYYYPLVEAYRTSRLIALEGAGYP